MTPEDIRAKEFRTGFRGYDEEEVDAFLDEVEAEMARLAAENAELRLRLAANAAGPAPASSETEELLRRALLLAESTASQTLAEAKTQAARMVGEARTKADAMVGDLDARRVELQREVDSLRAFEREYRTRLKAYLEGQLRELDSRAVATAPPGAPANPANPASRSVPAARPVVPTTPTAGPPPWVPADPAPSVG